MREIVRIERESLISLLGRDVVTLGPFDVLPRGVCENSCAS